LSGSEWIWDFFSLRSLIERTLQRREQECLVIDKTEKLPYSKLVCFCDALIDSPTYVFCADPGSSNYDQFYADQGYEGGLVADSYEEFVQVFLLQNGAILLNA